LEKLLTELVSVIDSAQNSCKKYGFQSTVSKNFILEPKHCGVRTVWGLLIEIFIVFNILFVCAGRVDAQALINEISSSTSPDWVEVYFYEGEDPNKFQLNDGSDSGNIRNLSEAVCVENICVVEWSNRLDNDGDTVILKNIESSEIIDQITYGGDGNVCCPGSGFSIGRIASLDEPFYPTNVWERFYTPSKGISNKNSTLNPCPSPTPVPTNTQTPTPMPTITPVLTKMPTNTLTPTRQPTTAPTLSVKPEDDLVFEDDKILGINEEGGVEQKIDEREKPDDVESKSKFPFVAGLFILAGLGLVSFPVVNYLKIKKNNK